MVRATAVDKAYEADNEQQRDTYGYERAEARESCGHGVPIGANVALLRIRTE
jgi:hypothetical protein